MTCSCCYAKKSRARARGFTLIELTVALLAGLIVAMGVVGLSRDATHTFHEEMRSSGAEAALRTAVDRLRFDLQRAGYMSTGNIVLDPQIAKPPGALNLFSVAAPGPLATGFARLASIYRRPGGSLANTPLSASNGIKPDLIQIGGNMTSADQFDVQLVNQAPTGNCTRILLSDTSPPMYRVLASGASAAQELRNMFQPTPVGDKSQFIVRLVDHTGRTQFLLTCPEAAAAGFTNASAGGAPPSGSYLDIDTVNTPIITTRMTLNNGGITGFGIGSLVNPVQIVQWELTSPVATVDPEPAQDQSILAGQPLTPLTPDATKYDLMRSYVDAFGNVVASTSEIVAEYAVDLAFAFSVDTSIIDKAPNVITYGFEDPADNDPWAKDVNLAGVTATQGPERIRVVRARIVTRTAQPDRNVAIGVTNYGSQAFMYRYQLDATDWARARTMVTQVALSNQTRNFY
jgi:prepilin-type N-terminal cleavage/methylation domain-containing protein